MFAYGSIKLQITERKMSAYLHIFSFSWSWASLCHENVEKFWISREEYCQRQGPLYSDAFVLIIWVDFSCSESSRVHWRTGKWDWELLRYSAINLSVFRNKLLRIPTFQPFRFLIRKKDAKFSTYQYKLPTKISQLWF